MSILGRGHAIHKATRWKPCANFFAFSAASSCIAGGIGQGALRGVKITAEPITVLYTPFTETGKMPGPMHAFLQNLSNFPLKLHRPKHVLMKGFFLLVFIFTAFAAFGQDNYEIQVYGAQTQAKGSTMFELHSNYTFNGQKQVVDGVLPSNHAEHETLEITTGITDNFEIGVYLFTNYTPGHGYTIVGSHIRPRIMAPAGWNLPFGLSLSMEAGYQKPAYSSETWNVEVRPIIDKQWPKFYASFNPTFGVSVKSKYDKSTPAFEPNIKMGYELFKNAQFGLEYYGAMGYISGFETLGDQEHALFVAYDMLNNPKWELNLGAGIGLTQATDAFVFKVILGRKVKWKK